MNGLSPATNKKPANCILFLLFGIILLISYSNSFHAAWQLDDKPNILTNYRLQLNELSFRQIWQASHAHPGSLGRLYRPVACVSLALNWFFGQDDVVGYHIVNFCIHFMTAWFLFLTIQTLFFTPALLGRYESGQVFFISATSALFWALNPIHTQTVTYIVQRMASLAALNALLAILFYLKARMTNDSKWRPFFLICAAIAYLLAVLSKENAIIIIFTLPVFEFLFFKHDFDGRVLRMTVGGVIGGLIISVVAAMAMRPELFDFIFNFYNSRPFTMAERFFTEQRILWLYLSQLFFPAPWRLSVEHNVVLSTSAITPWTTMAAMIAHGLLIAIAIGLRRKSPLFSLAVLFYYIGHLVESTILPLELVFEHRNYLPSFFLFVPLSILFHRGLTRFQRNKPVKILIVGLIVIGFTTLGYATHERNKVWQTEESLWLDAAKKSPGSARPIANLALRLVNGPNPDAAKYRKALELTRRSLSLEGHRNELAAPTLGNMASIYSKLGNLEASIEYYKKALAIPPENAKLRFNFSKILLMAGNFSGAKDELEKIFSEGSIHPDYFTLLGLTYLWMQQPERALPALRTALKQAPGRPDILLPLGKCFSLLGYYDKANLYFSLSRQMGLDDAVVSFSIIENDLRHGQVEHARVELQRSIDRLPLAYLLRTLHAKPAERYGTIPLSNEIIVPFLQRELATIATNVSCP
jgi:tetratricopeptide (TPR) repeat protein